MIVFRFDRGARSAHFLFLYEVAVDTTNAQVLLLGYFLICCVQRYRYHSMLLFATLLFFTSNLTCFEYRKKSKEPCFSYA